VLREPCKAALEEAFAKAFAVPVVVRSFHPWGFLVGVDSRRENQPHFSTA